MDIQTLVALVIVAAAAAYMGRRFIRTIRGTRTEAGAGAGCASGCGCEDGSRPAAAVRESRSER